MSKENVDFCRMLYKVARQESGCPPCIAFQLTPKHWGWYAETKDGSCSLEQIQADNAWDAKYQCVKAWEEQKQENRI